MADMPGIIEGAHRGIGLGDRFLRHIERARALVHLVDAAPPAAPGPAEAYRIVREEIAKYGGSVASKPELVVASKMDVPGAEKGLREIREAAGGEVLPISARTGRGLEVLVKKLFALTEPLHSTVPPSSR